jgi:non-homologous end joining protein Ku
VRIGKAISSCRSSRVRSRSIPRHPNEKISFHQINKDTGNRIKYRKVDAETGDEVESGDIIKGYEVGKGQYLEVQPEEFARE